ncbi:OTU domain-containing protein [Microbulbifer sp. JMSA003]|uniref:OTU domain-containing protein n=1 Tax=unclassified Microbulbifer TaxID=2619833 RepID=UPI00403A01AD
MQCIQVDVKYPGKEPIFLYLDKRKQHYQPMLKKLNHQGRESFSFAGKAGKGDLKTIPVKPDGNCMFNSVAIALNREDKREVCNNNLLRNRLADWIRENPGHRAVQFYLETDGLK